MAAEEDEEMVVVDQDSNQESAEAWASMLVGLSVVCEGLAAAVDGGMCEAEELQTLFAPDALVRLMNMCSSLPAL